MRVTVPFLLALSLVFCLSCQSPEETPAVWFVHATDPHLFQGDVKEEEGRSYQEKLNREAFSKLIQSLGSLPGMAPKPSFLVITGDFGLDGIAHAATAQGPATSAAPSPSQPAAPQPGGTTGGQSSSAEAGIARESAVNLLVGQLKASPVKDIYLVLGNNDVKEEAPGGAHVTQAATLLAEVQKRLAGSGVVLHDLTSCYRDGAQLPGGCSFDVPRTDFRLIGFSSFSFKNVKDRITANQKSQEEQVRSLATMVRQAGAQGKKVLIVTHIPEIDDPHPLGQFTGRGKAPERTDWARFSPWNVSDPVYQTWKSIVNSGTVAGVLAGHFHDSHKEIYYRPYRWANSPPERADLRKLFLAPPLSVRFQDTSPIQARGFAFFRLQRDEIQRNFYWYNPKDKTFKPDAALPKPKPAPVSNPFSDLIGWFWQVVLVQVDLARAVVLALAFLAAFLTAVQLWEIPPTRSQLATPAAVTGNAPAPEPTSGTASVLASNFAKTVLAGLGGMLVVDFLGDIWKIQEINSKAYYVLMFVIFFFLWLLAYALIQSAIEALRSRIATRRQPIVPRPALARRSGDSSGERQPGLWSRFVLWEGYFGNRIWRWVLSLRSFTLIFLDTFFNVFRGRNQFKTKVFEDTIIDLHRSIIHTADRIREEVDTWIVQTIRKKLKLKSEHMSSSDVRVNIAIFSEDESVLYYLSRERGSLSLPFDKNSVAWISVYTGEARWVKQSYMEKKDTIELFDNSAQRIPSLPATSLKLGSYYQMRQSPDYEAFLVLPFPLLRQAVETVSRRGAILISFRKESYLKALWDPLETGGDPGYKENWTRLLSPASQKEPEPGTEPELLGIKDEDLRMVLVGAVEILGELLHTFNDTVFEEYIKPNLQAVA